jgi:hypothetical protein
MAHFAHVDDDNLVTQVIVIGNEIVDPDETGTDNEQLGKDFIADTLGLAGTWVQTSYNNTFRNKLAAIGDTWDADADEFTSPKPYASFVWNNTTKVWDPPLAYPLAGLVDSDYPTGYPADFVTACEDDTSAVYVYEWREDEYQSDNTTGWFLVKQN